jgi:hypothetical protein
MATIQGAPKGKWIIRERERLTNAIERAPKEEARGFDVKGSTTRLLRQTTRVEAGVVLIADDGTMA